MAQRDDFGKQTKEDAEPPGIKSKQQLSFMATGSKIPYVIAIARHYWRNRDDVWYLGLGRRKGQLLFGCGVSSLDAERFL